MCHSCLGSSPVYSHVSGNPGNMEFYFLDSRFRGNDTVFPSRCCPHPANLRLAVLSREGERTAESEAKPAEGA